MRRAAVLGVAVVLGVTLSACADDEGGGAVTAGAATCVVDTGPSGPLTDGSGGLLSPDPPPPADWVAPSQEDFDWDGDGAGDTLGFDQSARTITVTWADGALTVTGVRSDFVGEPGQPVDAEGDPFLDQPTESGPPEAESVEDGLAAPVPAAVADVTGDGALDLIIVQRGTVSVVVGAGTAAVATTVAQTAIGTAVPGWRNPPIVPRGPAGSADQLAVPYHQATILPQWDLTGDGVDDWIVESNLPRALGPVATYAGRGVRVRKRLLAGLLLAGLLAGAGTGVTPAPEATAASPGRARTVRTDSPDPYVLRIRGAYYAYTTNRTASWGGVVHVPVLRSTNLANWTRAGDAMPNLPRWALPGFTWAPAVAHDRGGYALFYTAGERFTGRQCIGLARSRSPTGPFRDRLGGPFLCQHRLGGSIDASVFRDRNGTRYLLWKNDGNCCGRRVSLWSQRLTPRERLVGRPHRLLTYNRPWENPTIENPSMVRNPLGPRSYQLFYSGSWYASAGYATGLARCRTPLGPCVKLTRDRPWHGTTDRAYGPGGASFFTDFGGRNWMALHGWPRPPGLIGYPNRGTRALFVEKVDFSGAPPTVNTTFPYAYHRYPPYPFVDVPDWADDAVTWAYRARLVVTSANGPDFTFRPYEVVTRRVAVDLLRLALGPGATVNDFADPDLRINRSLTARLLYEAAGEPPVDDPEYDHAFTDVPPGAENAVRWLVHDPDGAGPEAAIDAGFPDGTFRPSGAVDRATYVVMLHRMLTLA